MVIGIDVGGTNTDSVLVKIPEKEIEKATKVSTTKDIFSGVSSSISQLVDGDDISQRLKAVILGTTAFLNAVL